MRAWRVVAIVLAVLVAVASAPSTAWAERGYQRFTGRGSANPGFREGKFGSRQNYRVPRFQRLPSHGRQAPGPRRPSVGSGAAR